MDDVNALTRDLDGGISLPASWYFNHQVSGEDDRLTDSVQRGLRAGLPERGRFLRRSEHLIVQFQKLALGAMA